MNAMTKPEATAIAPRTGGFDWNPQSFDQAWTMANHMADSDLVPKDYRNKPANCLVAMQWGAEIGLKALQSVQSIAVINGRPAMWGDAMLALVRSSPVCEFVVETDDGTTATCRVKRRGEPEQSRTFSVEDAQKAGLSGKDGPWRNYPKRMRQLRARAYALRDVFTDVLRGLAMAEEVQDIPAPAEKHMGPVQEVSPPAPDPAPAATERPAYPQADFDKNLQSWLDAISAGKTTADAVIAKIETKGSLTEAQKNRIHGVLSEGQAPTASEVIEGEAREAAEGSAE